MIISKKERNLKFSRAKILGSSITNTTLNIDYFFLCRFFLKRFLRLWVAILCLFLFFPLGIWFNFLSKLVHTNFFI